MDIIAPLRGCGLYVLGLTLAAHLGGAPVPSAPYTGMVVDANGAPVGGATVHSYRDPSAVTASAALDLALSDQSTTDGKGGFTVSAGSGLTVLVARKEGFAPAWKTLSPARDSPADPLVLTEPTTLAGTVVDETGRPVAYAEVWVAIAQPTLASPAARAARSGAFPSPIPVLVGKPARDAFLVTTGGDGRFLFTNFPPATQADLGARKPGKAQAFRANSVNTLPYASGQQDINLTLAPTANLEGKVIIASTGQPVSGVKLRWMITNDLPEPVASDADGTFRFTGVAPGEAVISASFPGQPMPDWAAEDVLVRLAPGETRKGVVVRALRCGTVAIKLTSRDLHQPVPNMAVSAYSSQIGQFSSSSAWGIPSLLSAQGIFSSLSAEGITGPDGVAWLRLLPDDWGLYLSGRQRGQLFTSDDRLASQPGFTVRSHQTNRLDFLVDLGLPLSGTVCAPDGSPVSGAIVSLDSGQQAKADAAGRYELRRPRPLVLPSEMGARSASLRVLARSVERDVAVAKMIPEDSTNLNLILQPCVTLSARVVDTSGRAVTNAVGQVFLSTHGSRISGYGQEAVPTANSDAQGRLEFYGLLQTEGYSLSVAAQGYGSGSTTVEMPALPSTRLAFPTVILPIAHFQVAGTVVDTNGQPLAGETVSISGAVQPSSRAETDATGHFHFDAVVEGEVFLRASRGGSARAVAGDTNVVLSMPLPSEIRMRVDAQLSPERGTGGRRLSTNGQDTVASTYSSSSSYFSSNFGSTADALNRMIQRAMDDRIAAGAAPSTRATITGARGVVPSAWPPGARGNPGPAITGTVRDASGAPAAGVHLKPYNDSDNRHQTQTDSQGRYFLPMRGRDETIIARDLERNLAATHKLEPAATNLDLVLQPGLTLSCAVQDEYGNPMPTAIGSLLVQAGPSPSAPDEFPLSEDLITQLTPMASLDSRLAANDQGVIEVKALPRGGHYSMNITAREYNSAKADAPAEATQTARFECPVTVLKLVDRILAGQVLDADGNPLSSVQVYLGGFGQREGRTTTDSQGRFTFDQLCEGTVQVSAVGLAGSGSGAAMTGAQAGDTNVVLRFSRPAPRPPPAAAAATPQPETVTNSGRVFDTSGGPLAGARVTIVPDLYEKSEATTDTDGKYLLMWRKRAPGPMDAMINGPRFLYVRDETRNLMASRNVDGTEARIDLRLEPGLTVAVKVQASDGKPIPTATASLTLPTRASKPDFNRLTAKASEQGLIEFRALPHGRRLEMTIAANGYGSATLDVLEAHTDGTRYEFPTTVLKPANRTLFGQVLRADGKPVPGVTVHLSGDLQKSGQATSDAQGRFVFRGLSEVPARVGAYLMVGDERFLSGGTEVSALATNVTLWLGVDGLNNPKAGVVTTSGTVFDSSGKPAAGVSLFLLPALALGLEARSDANGRYSLTWQNIRNDPGSSPNQISRYLLLARDAEHGLAAVASLEDNLIQHVDLHLQSGLTLSGSVRGEDGRPISHASLQLILCPMNVRRLAWNQLPLVETSSEGAFSIGALPQGASYLLHVAAQGYGTNLTALADTDTRTSQLQLPPIILKLANRKVTGQVLTRDGQPAPGARLSLWGDGQPDGVQGLADANGQFVLEHVCTGPVEVRALPANRMDIRAATTVQAKGGDMNVVIRLP